MQLLVNNLWYLGIINDGELMMNSSRIDPDKHMLLFSNEVPLISYREVTFMPFELTLSKCLFIGKFTIFLSRNNDNHYYVYVRILHFISRVIFNINVIIFILSIYLFFLRLLWPVFLVLYTRSRFSVLDCTYLICWCLVERGSNMLGKTFIDGVLRFLQLLLRCTLLIANFSSFKHSN